MPFGITGQGKAGSITPLTCTSIQPAGGSTAGGDVVDIYGSGFELGMTAKMGGTLCTGLVVQSANQLTCTTPAGTGTDDVRLDRITTAANATLSNGWTYDFSPVDLSPALAYYSDTGTTGSPAITAWVNQGSTGVTNDLANSGAPTISASGGPNGEPRVNSVGTARMQAGARRDFGTAGTTLWIVCRVTSTTKLTTVFKNDRFIVYSADTSGIWSLFNQGVADNPHDTAVATGAWQCIEIDLDFTVPNTVFTLGFRVNGVASTPVVGQGYSAGAIVTTVGGSNATLSSDAAADADVALVVATTGVASAGNKTAMRAWLLANYGVTA